MARKSMSVLKYTALGVAPRGGCFNRFEVALLAQKVLSELARDAEKGTAKSQNYKKAA